MPYPCPDNKTCSTHYLSADSSYQELTNPNLTTYIIVLVLVWGMYLKLRPSFSSYFIAIPFHLGALILLFSISLHMSRILLSNEFFRHTIGICKTTEGLIDGTCVPLCLNDKVPLELGHQGTPNIYKCVDQSKDIYYNTYIYIKKDYTTPFFSFLTGRTRLLST